MLRAADELEESSSILRQAGLEPVAAPALEIRELPPDLESARRIAAADIVIFASARAVRIFFSGAWHAAVISGQARVISIGERTQTALNRHGVETLKPASYSSSGLVELIRALPSEGKAVVVLRSREGSSTLSMGLREMGYDITEIALYSVGYPRNDDLLRALVRDIAEGGIYAIPFTSAMMTRNFFRCAEMNCIMLEFMKRLGECSLWSIGPETSAVLRESGAIFREARVADYGAIAVEIASAHK